MCIQRECDSKMTISVSPLAFCHSSHPLCSRFELKLWWSKRMGVVSCLCEWFSQQGKCLTLSWCVQLKVSAMQLWLWIQNCCHLWTRAVGDTLWSVWCVKLKLPCMFKKHLIHTVDKVSKLPQITCVASAIASFRFSHR